MYFYIIELENGKYLASVGEYPNVTYNIEFALRYCLEKDAIEELRKLPIDGKVRKAKEVITLME